MAAVPDLAFFIGKGGVGKTTVSAAYALWLAQRRPQRPVLLVSTDPAHSLADVLLQKFGSRPRPARIPRGALYVWQVDAQRQFRKFLGRYRPAILKVLESGTIFTREEIAPLLDTTLPGLAEISALLALEELLESERYAHIVVDTAPIGHTLRLFELPEHFSRLLEFLETAGARDRVLAEHFGGGRTVTYPFLEEWRRMVERVRGALTAEHARLVLVTSPEAFALNESLRVAEQLRASAPELAITDVVLNRAVTSPGRCAACRDQARQAESAAKFLKANFPGARYMTGADPGGPILGARSLTAFGAHVFDRRALRLASPPPPASQQLTMSEVAWPKLDAPLSFTMGKGGVGKTTISAALAWAERRREKPLVICSTDPAPSLDDVFLRPVGDRAVPVFNDPEFAAMEMDSVAEFRRWASEMKDKVTRALSSDTRGVHVDLTFDREILLRLLDIVPPGVDELFAIFRILDLLETRRGAHVVIDMAPTGHALELLRMPQRMLLWSRLLLKSLAAHRTLPLARDVAVEVARVSQRVRELAAMLADRKRAAIWTVMLAEPLPDRETGRLLRDLNKLQVPVRGLFVNRVLFSEDVAGCRRCGSARAWQLATVARQKGPVYVTRNVPGGVAGKAKLTAFTNRLWQTTPDRAARRSR